MNYYLAEHMDCFYYVNDIIELDVPKINKILISNLLNRLLRPMYLDSLLTASSSASVSNKTTSVWTSITCRFATIRWRCCHIKTDWIYTSRIDLKATTPCCVIFNAARFSCPQACTSRQRVDIHLILEPTLFATYSNTSPPNTTTAHAWSTVRITRV